MSLIKNGVTYNYACDANDAPIHSSGSSKYYVNGANGQTEAVVDVTNPGIITHNIWGNDLVGQVRRNGGLTRYYHLKDHLGSIRVTVDAAGNAVAHDDYDPWGMLMDGRSYNAGQADARYKFTGKEKDTETGLDYFGTRYYDSRIGRWMSVDPLSSKYLMLSPFNYSANNPVKFFDPDGYSVKDMQKRAEQIRKMGSKYTNSNRQVDAKWKKLDTGFYDNGGIDCSGFGYQLNSADVDSRVKLSIGPAETQAGEFMKAKKDEGAYIETRDPSKIKAGDYIFIWGKKKDGTEGIVHVMVAMTDAQNDELEIAHSTPEKEIDGIEITSKYDAKQGHYLSRKMVGIGRVNRSEERRKDSKNASIYELIKTLIQYLK